MMRYPKGSLVNCRGAFTNADTGAYVDPVSVTFRVGLPSGGSSALVYGVDAAVVKEAVGRYKVAVSAAVTGQYSYRFESTGEYQGAADGSFEVTRSKF